jgi:hypothetical protein
MTLKDYSIPHEIQARALHAQRRRRNRKILTLTTLGVAGLIAGLIAGLLAGCSGGLTATSATATTSHAALAGNWKFSSTSANARGLSSLAGSLSVSGSQVTGALHPLSGTCASPSTTFAVTGSIDTHNLLSLASTNFPGGALTLSGTIADDQKSLSAATYTVAAGACAFPAAKTLNSEAISPRDNTAPVTAQQFQPITGSYTGSFSDSDGVVLPLTASLSQPSTPDANGVYHLTGYATFDHNPCLNTPVVTDSAVTGDTISATYTDPTTHNTVTGSGTFSPDAATLTITNWILSGNCGSDTGTGLLARN